MVFFSCTKSLCLHAISRVNELTPMCWLCHILTAPTSEIEYLVAHSNVSRNTLATFTGTIPFKIEFHYHHLHFSLSLSLSLSVCVHARAHVYARGERIVKKSKFRTKKLEFHLFQQSNYMISNKRTLDDVNSTV